MKRLTQTLPLGLVFVMALTLASCADDPEQNDLRTRDQGILIGDLPELGGDYPDVLIQGLSRQLIDELNCIEPGVLVEFEVAEEPGRLFTENNIPHMLRPEAVEAAEAVAALEGDHLTITSGYRDVGMQYYDYLRGMRFGFLAARPGGSRHQAGRAIDVDHHTFWRQKLIDGGWRWPLGDRDRPHFEWPSEDVPDLKLESVRAFQRLWNRNNPTDIIEEDGDFGPITESRLALTEAEGFEYGGCDLDLDTHADMVIGGDDCDDERSDVHPGATEICDDGIDQDCDGVDLPCEPDPTDAGTADAEDHTPDLGLQDAEEEDAPAPEQPDAPESDEDASTPPLPPAFTQQSKETCACQSLALPTPSPWPWGFVVLLWGVAGRRFKKSRRHPRQP